MLFRTANKEVIDTEVLRVLLVDGNVSFRDALQLGLTKADYKIKLLAVKNTREMEFQVSHETIDIVILSMSLPAEDSLHALEFLLGCKRDRAGFPYVIALSPVDEPQNNNLIMACGADDIIFISVSIQEIFERIRRFEKALQFCDNGMVIPLSQSIEAAQL